MLIIESQKKIHESLRDIENIALIPTMGNLHEGHIALIETAKKISQTIVVTIFVNPIQFNSKKDLDAYPRTLEKDIKILEKLNVNFLFTPTVKDMYPTPPNLNYKLPKISHELCGATRPEHFEGVITIIEKLFDLFKPAYAIFGKKDYQQLYLIKKFTLECSYSTKIIEIETCRETNKLALSSRNNLLKFEMKEKAVELYLNLNKLVTLSKSISMLSNLELNARENLEKNGWEVDYIEVRRQSDLKKPIENDSQLIALGAATLNGIRLIDNIEFCIETLN